MQNPKQHDNSTKLETCARILWIKLQLKKIIRNNDGHHVIIKRQIYQVTVFTINIYIPNTGASSYISQLLINLKQLKYIYLQKPQYTTDMKGSR